MAPLVALVGVKMATEDLPNPGCGVTNLGLNEANLERVVIDIPERSGLAKIISRKTSSSRGFIRLMDGKYEWVEGGPPITNVVTKAGSVEDDD